MKNLKNNFKIKTDSPYYYLGVLVVALLVFIVSFYYVQQGIKRPFKISEANYKAAAPETEQQVDASDIEALKKLDTDEDGLSDYLELYVYNTSIYIQDTDSDGLSDSQEVMAGKNPLCDDIKGCNTGIFNEQPVDDTKFTGSAEELRLALIDIGFKDGELDGLSLTDMQELYTQANKVLTGEYMDINDQINSSYDNLYDLSASELRDLLVQTGVAESEIANISDGDLLQLYQEALNEVQ